VLRRLKGGTNVTITPSANQLLIDASGGSTVNAYTKAESDIKYRTITDSYPKAELYDKVYAAANFIQRPSDSTIPNDSHALIYPQTGTNQPYSTKFLRAGTNVTLTPEDSNVIKINASIPVANTLQLTTSTYPEMTGWDSDKWYNILNIKANDTVVLADRRAQTTMTPYLFIDQGQLVTKRFGTGWIVNKTGVNLRIGLWCKSNHTDSVGLWDPSGQVEFLNGEGVNFGTYLYSSKKIPNDCVAEVKFVGSGIIITACPWTT
jgi:hypothetical protein